MEFRKSFDIRKFLIISYVLVFGLYLGFGFQPAEAEASREPESFLVIPSINLISDIAKVELENNRLITPDEIIGSYSRNDNKVFLFGHSTTVFQDLDKLKIGSVIVYKNRTYYVTDITTKAKEDIVMNNLLSESDNATIVLMTCAGELYENGGSSHRLIITAES